MHVHISERLTWSLAGTTIVLSVLWHVPAELTHFASERFLSKAPHQTTQRLGIEYGYNPGFDSGSYDISAPDSGSYDISPKKMTPAKPSKKRSGMITNGYPEHGSMSDGQIIEGPGTGSMTDGKIIDGHNGSGSITNGYTLSGTITDGYTLSGTINSGGYDLGGRSDFTDSDVVTLVPAKS